MAPNIDAARRCCNAFLPASLRRRRKSTADGVAVVQPVGDLIDWDHEPKQGVAESVEVA